ncbi:MAG: DnaD domain protein [Oscillospiraceae bacterium]|jgi:DnaD/phage-associated family protein|nr:DnaD domain protein [Oscillospiraceae bacterium]
MTYRINFERYANTFCLPREIADEGIATIDGATLKVALLIFRNAGKNYSISLLSSLLSLPESKIEEAVSYWIERGLLLAESGQQKEQPAAQILPEGKPAAVSPAPLPVSGELSFLLECLENLLGRPVTSVEYKSVVHILEYIRLPADVVIMAAEYSISIQKFSARSLEKLCAAWSDSGITTHERAEQYLSRLKTARQNEEQIKQLFGIQNRSLIDSEKEQIARWFGEFGFQTEIIKLAYERTITAINKLSFPYINKILQSWHEKGYSTLDAVLTNEGIRKQQGSASYDIDELEEYWKNNVPKL